MDKTVLDGIAGSYTVEKDYDYFNTQMALKIFLPYLSENVDVLEIGTAEGVMTRELVKHCKNLDVLEPSSVYVEKIKAINGIRNIYHCYLEDVADTQKYDVILLAALLHHIEDPVDFLVQLKPFLKESGVVLATVPNMVSLHRQMGVEMGVLDEVSSTTERNKRFHQFGRFTKDSLVLLFESSKFQVIDSYGYMLKPFSSSIMDGIKLTDTQVDALFKLGKQHQDLSSQLFIEARVDD